MKPFELQIGYVPGVIGRLVALHAQYYSANWGFGSFFEAKVAGEMATFIQRYDPDRDGVWTVADTDGIIQGGLVIDGLHAAVSGAHLRWFIVSEIIRGTGSGGRLIHEAMRFCRDRNYSKVYLWTFEGLHAARHLYETAGFRLVSQKTGEQWGREVNEQKFEAILNPAEGNPDT